MNIAIVRGATFRRRLRLVDIEVADCADVAFTLRPEWATPADEDDDNASAHVRLSGGGIVATGPAELTVEVPHEVTAQLWESTYRYDVKAVLHNGRKHQLVRGEAILDPHATVSL